MKQFEARPGYCKCPREEVLLAVDACCAPTCTPPGLLGAPDVVRRLCGACPLALLVGICSPGTPRVHPGLGIAGAWLAVALTVFSLTHGIASSLPQALGVSAGGEHSCVILPDGRAVCFGAGGDGRLGNEATGDVGDNGG